MNNITHPHHNQFRFFPDAETTSSLDISSVQNNEDLNDDFSEFIDIPNLVSDDESGDDDNVSINTFRSLWKNSGRITPATTVQSSFVEQQPTPPTQQTQSVSSNNKESILSKAATPILQTQRIQQPVKKQTPSQLKIQPKEHTIVVKQEHTERLHARPSQQVKKSIPASTALTTTTTKSQQLSPEQFKNERIQLMTIIVKYIATKIHNSFPPESPRQMKPNELPLDKFLLLLTCRLQLTLPLFMKGIIYLFRYMDIIYLLRYLNQSNNFINYKDMGFELKKLIVGCFKLTILKERRIHKDRFNYNWHQITGLTNQETNSIVKKIVSRMNGKLNIKDVELVRMKSELFRFVKMVSTEV
ncbi:uncharacterized protein J8A68_005981 [[Candida] subhashii]|uniref:Uncharacterized protein n=1 Tax=[Candida] subhashii TaxID=561895 RepID=A0A8J5QEQ5_9ASCO|nr:uncharacterized protein J8A68_005981 [[Candida] subhashii]KAG7660562.1 hypothetical protein J8A68_005981 [[Candida] subhashii]